MKGFIKSKALYLLLAVILLVSVLPLGILPIITSSQPAYAAPADAYWVGGTGTWSDATNHWATTSNGSPGAGNLPATTTNVHFDAYSLNASSRTVTIGATAYCRDMDWTGAVNRSVLYQSVGHTWLYGNLTFSANMTTSALTIWLAGSGTITYPTTNGIEGTFLLSTTGTYSLLNNASHASGTIDLRKGTFNTNNFSVLFSGYNTGWDIAGTDAKVLNLGSSVCTIGGWYYSGSNLTLNANTSTIILTGSSANFYFVGSGLTFNNVILQGTPYLLGSNTIGNLSYSGATTITLTSGTTQTITGSLNISGTNSGSSRELLTSKTLASPATLHVDGDWTGTQNVDFRDITSTHPADLSAITGGSGDCGGNTNITFTTPAPQYWYADTGSWSNASKWFLGTGGSGGSGRVPLPQDAAVIDVNSITGASKTITEDMPRVGSINFSGVASTPAFTKSISFSIYGSLNLTGVGTYSGNFGETFSGRNSSYTLNTGGKTIYALTVTAPTGILTIQDNLAVTGAISVTAGNFSTNSKTVSSTTFTESGSGARALDISNSIITLSGTGTKWGVTTFAGLVFSSTNSSIILTSGAVTACTFGGIGLTYNNVTIQGAGIYTTTFSGSNAFNVLTIDRTENKSILITQSTTQKVTDFICATSGTKWLTIGSTTTTAGTLNKSGGGRVIVDYIALSRNTGLPVSTWYYDVNNTIGAGVTNWNQISYYNLSVVGSPLAGGTPAFTGSNPFILDSVVPIQANTDSCYTFTGWTPTANITDPSLENTTVTMTDNKSLTANYTIKTYDLTTASSAGGDVTDPGESTYTYNCSDVVDIEATVDPCYHFVNWTGDTGEIADVNDPTTTISMTANASITANFAIDVYMGEYFVSGVGGTVNGSWPENVNCGDDSSWVLATPDPCYHFVDWDDASTTNPRHEVNVTSDFSFDANFAIDVYTVGYIAGVGGTVNGSWPENVNCGDDSSWVLATPDPCYHFVNWSDSSTDNPRQDTNVTSNISVTANFAGDNYDLTTASTAGGNVTAPGEGIYNHACNDIVNLVATADPCRYFVNWTGDTGDIADVNDPTTTITMTANASVTANFAIITYTLAVLADPVAGGTPSFDGSSPFNCSDVVVIHAGLNPCWLFTGWTPVTGINDSTLEDAEIIMSANTVLTAHYSSDMVLTLSSSGGGDVTTPTEGVHHYNCSDVVPLVATPDAFYYFVDWTGAVGTVDDVNDPTTNVTMNGSYNIKANFAIVGGLYPPTNLSVTMTSGACFNMTWTMGVNASSTIFVICEDTPRDCSDTDFGNFSTGCYLLYNGSGTSLTFDYCGLDLNSYNYYITGWSSNGSGYSPVCASITIGGGDMVDALYTGLAAFIALGLSAIGFWQKKTWVFLLAGMAWVGFGIWELTSGASGTLYWYFGWLGLVAGLVMFLAPAWNWKKDKSKTFLDADEEYSRQIDRETGKTKKED
jgi:uncharacterized repeat protein (TIGR02543 family)